MLDFDFSVEHVLMFMIAIFLLYHLVGSCGCMKDGFSVGGEEVCVGETCKQRHCQECGILKHCGTNLSCAWINNESECPGKEGWYCVK